MTILGLVEFMIRLTSVFLNLNVTKNRLRLTSVIISVLISDKK